MRLSLSLLGLAGACAALTFITGCTATAEEEDAAGGGSEAITGAKTKVLASGGLLRFETGAGTSRGFYVAGIGGDIQLFTADGAPPKVVVHRPGQSIDALAASEDALVWWDSVGNDLHAAAIDGSNDVVIMHAREVLCQTCWLFSDALRGMMPDWLRAHYMSWPKQITLHGKDVYFTEGTGHLYRARADQAGSYEVVIDIRETPALANDKCVPYSMAADGSSVYLATNCEDYGQLERIDVGSKRRTVLDSVAGQWARVGAELSLDHDVLTYLAHRAEGAERADGSRPFTGELRRLPVAGGTPQVLTDIEDVMPGLAVIGDTVYTAHGRATTPGQVEMHEVVDVLAAPLAGGPPVKVTTLMPSPGRTDVSFYSNQHGIGTDGRSLYMLASEDAPDGIRSHVVLIDTK